MNIFKELLGFQYDFFTNTVLLFLTKIPKAATKVSRKSSKSGSEDDYHCVFIGCRAGIRDPKYFLS